MQYLNCSEEKMLGIEEIKKILPHRYPLLLVDRVNKLEPYKNIDAHKNISINEDIFNGHFPNNPIYPGVYIIEGLAQAGVILALYSKWGDNVSSNHGIAYFMGIDKAKFRVPVRPGDKLIYRLEFMGERRNVWILSARAYVEERLVAEAELKAILETKG